jgi:hypothetical protein
MKVQDPVLKQELGRRDGLPGDIAAPENLGELRRETVLLIHGTFANKAASAQAWWLPESEFCLKLNSSLSQQGSPARCWAHFGTQNGVFGWTGGVACTVRLYQDCARWRTRLRLGPDEDGRPQRRLNPYRSRSAGVLSHDLRKRARYTQDSQSEWGFSI